MSFPRIELETWKKQAEKESGGPVEALETTLREGIKVQPLYTSAPLIHAISRWNNRKGSVIAPRHEVYDPAAAREDLGGGAAGIFLVLDRAARLGRENDAARDGAVLSTAAELAELTKNFGGENRLLLDAGANILPAAALLLAANVKARVVLGGDPLGALARDGTVPRPLEVLERELVAAARYFTENKMRARAATVSTRAYHEAGADAADELAFALATGLHYVRLLDNGGLGDVAAHQLTFSFSVGRDVFLEIAKLRAFRVAWQKVGRAIGRGGNVELLHAEASRRTLTQRDPWVNMLRVTTEMFAAICAGADVITPQSFDAAIGDPDALGRRVARNTPLVLVEEGLLGSIHDPAQGSYYVETLTDALAREGWKRFQQIEALGGMKNALLSGKVGQMVAKSAQALERENLPIVGVTDFVNAGEEKLERPSRSKPRAAARSVDVGGHELLSLFAAASRGASIFDLSDALDDGKTPPQIAKFELRRDSRAAEGGAK